MTARDELRRYVHLTAVDIDGRRIYHPPTTPEGQPPMSNPLMPMRDHERVLGQIERGEVRVGPDTAREIAARHQEAYGEAFDGTPAEALRRQLWTASVFTTTEGGMAA
ncbi:hypothetical protein [Streptomyces sp. NPDC049590]|uniref:hypothetical protein n=1 Tax=Streptomyces sp. NPDC049590 TaxID=3154834 RepID=UPI00343D5355